MLSADKENDHDIVSLVAASAALSLTDIGWRGPISGIRVGRVEGKLIFNPTYAEREQSDLDLIVSSTQERVVMIEAGAEEIGEDEMFEAIWAGHKNLQEPIKMITKMAEEVGTKPVFGILPAHHSPEEIANEEEKQKTLDTAREWLEKNTKEILFDKTYYTKGERKLAVQAIKEKLDLHLFELGIGKEKRAFASSKLVETMVEKAVTDEIITNKRRVDGRGLDQIRELYSEASILPRNHGSGLFSRGETQVMSIVTLGSPGMVQMLEGLEGQSTKRYMHHYNFPPYSVGEVKPIFSAGRREIGHGALAEKALVPVLPAREDFPYTIRVVSETLSSNGSSSMGATCGSSLALMDAGVPIKKSVAGIAMGLASNEDMSRWEVLTDIQDLEDGKGGMDFKIAGTKDGITAIQLDTKTIGLDSDIVRKTLDQGKAARLEIISVMEKAIESPRPDLSPYAPRLITLQINPDKIRDVIGSGGKVINEIIAATGVTIDIEQDGTVVVCGVEADKCQEAIDWINNIVREIMPGELFKGKVVRMLDFGAFVELTPGKDGMVHVSELAPYRIEKPSDFIALGDELWVRVKEIDDQGRVNLTMRNIPENEELWKNEKGKSNREQFGGGGGRGGHSGPSDRGGSRPPRRY